MAISVQEKKTPSAITLKDYKVNIRPNWCPGCGDFSVLMALQKSLTALQLNPKDVAVVAGIGCSGRISGYLNAYGFHSLHGRALATAQGIKLANPELTVIAAGGDGDAFAIGMSQTIHAMRRNMDITYIVMDNQVYGLTKGQTSPRSSEGFKTSSTPYGSVEQPVHPIQLALSANATFIAQGFSSEQDELQELIRKAIEHKGFSLVNVFSPCVTYNKVNTYDWFRQHVVQLPETYNPHDKSAALQAAHDTDGLCLGVIYEEERPPYDELIPGYAHKPYFHEDLQLSKELFEEAMAEFQ